MTNKKTLELPRVSIIVPCYNHDKFIKESIESIINQDYKNIELIVIDDGSSDSSVAVIQELVPECEARFVRFEFRHRANKGLCLTLNEALEWCQGEFLAGVASDDTLKPYKTSLQVDYLINNPESIGVFGAVERVYEATGLREIKSTPTKKFNFNQIFLHQHRLPASTSLLRIKPIRDIGGYKEAFLLEDWYLWLFLTQNGGNLDYIDVVLGTYRRHAENMSLNRDLMERGRLEVLNIFKNHHLYKKALAQVYFIIAIEHQQDSNYKKTVKYLTKAITSNYRISLSIMNYYFKKFILKSI